MSGTENEKTYNLNDRDDFRTVLTAITRIGLEDSLIFPLVESPVDGNLGKLGYSAQNSREHREGAITLDVVETDLGLMLVATCAALAEN